MIDDRIFCVTISGYIYIGLWYYIDSCLSCDVCIITYIPSNKSSAIHHILMCIPVGAKVCNIIDLNNYCFVGYYSVF